MEAREFLDITQLLSRYCHVVDEKAWDRLEEIFAVDASMTVTGIYERHSGFAELRALYGEKMNHPIAHNSTSVVVLEHTVDTAKVKSKWVTVRADGGAGAGVYHDDLVRTEHGWRIRTRVATPAARPS